MVLFTYKKNQVLVKIASIVLAWAVLQAAALQTCLAQTGEAAVTLTSITRVESLVTTADTPPPRSADWTATTLPYLRSFREATDPPGYVWLRFSIPAASTDEKLGLLITRHMRNLNFYVNGELLHAERGNTPRDYLGWNTPLLVELQTATLAHPQNEIVIGLYQSVGSTYLNAVTIGPYSQVEPRYREAWRLQVQIPFTAFVACLVLGLLTFGLWVTRRQSLEYLYFCTASLCWALVMLFMYLPYPLLMNLKPWIVLSYFNTNLAALAFMGFIARVLRFHARFWLMLGFTFLCLCCLTILMLPPRIGFLLAGPLHGATVFALLVLSMLALVQYRRLRTSNTAWMLASLLAILLLAALDMLRFFEAFRTGEGFAAPTLTPFSLPFALAILFTHIIRQYWHALRASERLNQELVQRVRSATTELERHLHTRHQQALQESTQQQRQQIYRDLHDDVGAKLTSILHAADTDKQKQMARAALESLRETIHHANYRQQTLQELINCAAEEIQTRLHAAGLRFEPPPQVLDSDRELSSTESYHLTRALREITNNILNHARATVVQLQARSEGRAGYLLEVEDDGCGFLPGGAHGNGVNNIAQRLQELGGNAVWNSAAGKGCKVQLWLPAQADEISAA